MSIIKELLQKSEHYSGYERQTAVTALAPYAEAAVLEVLLRRANDWVPQVRSAAKQSLRHQLQGPQGFVLFYQHLPDCFALERSPRESHQMLLQEIIHHLGLQAVERRLYTSICKDQPRLAQWSWISALTHKILPSNVLLELGLEHPYAALRHVALKLWKAQAPEYQRLLALMHLKCRFSAVRENALRTLLSQSQPIPHRHTMIWDTSPWIRLNILPTLDPQAVITAYNYALHHPLNNTRLKIALWGMGHLKCPQVKSQIMIYAQQNKSLSVKRAALQAIMQGYLSQIQQRQLVETLFEHPALSIVRLALHWNKKLKIQHTASQWLKKRMNVPPSHYPLFAEAMRHSNKWEFLHFLLATGASPDILFSWLSAFNRKAQQPTQKQKQAIEKHWSKRIPHAPKDLKQVLSQSGIKLT